MGAELFLAYLDVVFVEFDGFCCISNGIAVRLEFDVGLGAIAVERGICIVSVYRLGVEIHSRDPVMPSEGLVALDFQSRCGGLVLGRVARCHCAKTER